MDNEKNLTGDHFVSLSKFLYLLRDLGIKSAGIVASNTLDMGVKQFISAMMKA